MKRDHVNAFPQPYVDQYVEPKRQRFFVNDSLPPLSSILAPPNNFEQQNVVRRYSYDCNVPSSYAAQVQPMQQQYYGQMYSSETLMQRPEIYQQTAITSYTRPQYTPPISIATPISPQRLEQPSQPRSPQHSPPVSVVKQENVEPKKPKEPSPPPKTTKKKTQSANTQAPATTSSSPTPSSQSSSDSSDGEEDVAKALRLKPIPTVDNPRFDFHQLQPIRILAYQIGLSADPNKSYRYRDIKRALFEKCSKEHCEMVNVDPDHSLLHQRLPHKLSLAQFCKRVMLLVFHHIVRDGREPRFWRQKGVKQDLIRKILKECEPDFYRKVNVKVALLLHSYVAAGMTFEGAMNRIREEGHMSTE
jgi:hypothetical protein